MKKQLTVLFQLEEVVEERENQKKFLEQIKDSLGKGSQKTAEGGQREMTTRGDIKAPKTGDPGTFKGFSQSADDYKPLMNSKGQEVKRQHAATFRQNNPDDPAVVHNKKSDALKQMQARAAQQQQPEPQQKTEPTPAPTPEPQAQEKPVDTRPPSEKKKEKKQEPVNLDQE